MEAVTTTRVRGQIREVLHQDPTSGFGVLRVRATPGGVVCAVGPLAGLIPGEEVTLFGEWADHPRWGRQFRSRDVARHLPTSEDGLRRFLAGSLVRGVGERIAARLVSLFGAQTLEVIEREPARLTGVRGLGPRRREALVAAVTRLRGLRDLAVFLCDHGVGGITAQRLWAELGPGALALLREDPYQLVGRVRGVGFVRADALAGRLGIAPAGVVRLRAATRQALTDATRLGHVFYPRELLVRRVESLTGAPAAAIEPVLEGLIDQGEVVSEGMRCYEPALYDAEVEVAHQLTALASAPPRLAGASTLVLSRIAQQAGLDAPQHGALELLTTANLLVITGPPGTGKTTVMRALHRWLARERCRVALCAPTGRAARRLAEVVGAPAFTLHRLLALRRTASSGEHGPLVADAVLVDETSMVDLPLFRALVSRLAPGTVLVLVGDEDQLPSIGPGSVLADVIRSGRFPVARLSRNFRQGPGGGIVRAAHAIRRGQSPLGPDSAPELSFQLEPDAARAATMVATLAASHPGAQVLSPMNRGAVGVHHLNALVRAQTNPDARPLGFGSTRLFQGDRVIHLANDYRRDLYNGDTGRLVAVDRQRRTVAVEFGGRTHVFRDRELDALAPAFALSVHKAQGSEYPVIILPIFAEHAFLLRRRLLYTAITRARERVILVGTPFALSLALRLDPAAARHTALAERLRAGGRPAG